MESKNGESSKNVDLAKVNEVEKVTFASHDISFLDIDKTTLTAQELETSYVAIRDGTETILRLTRAIIYSALEKDDLLLYTRFDALEQKLLECSNYL